MKKTIPLLLVCILLLQTLTMTATAAPAPSGWAAREVELAKTAGIVTDKTTKNYTAAITREEFCELVVVLYEKLTGDVASPRRSNFTDTDNPEIWKAYNLGIVYGISDTEFAPDRTITRQEICVMLVRCIDKAITDADVSQFDETDFADIGSIASWALPSVQYAFTHSIMQGVGGNKIDPLGMATCEQSILLAYRIFDNYKPQNSGPIVLTPKPIPTDLKATDFPPLPNRSDVVFDTETPFLYVPGRAYIRFDRDSATMTSAVALISRLGGDILWSNLTNLSFVVMFDYSFTDYRHFEAFLDGLAGSYGKSEGIAFITVDTIIVNETQMEIPNDPWGINPWDIVQGMRWNTWGEDGYTGNWDGNLANIPKKWGMEAIRAPFAWAYSDLMEPVKVGVVDNGFYMGMNKADYPITIINKEYTEEKNHGTHVAGIIGATPNNRFGVTGVAWNADLYGFDFDYDGRWKDDEAFTYAFFRAGIEFMAECGVRVINASLGQNYKESDSKDRIDELVKKDRLFFEDMLRDLKSNGHDMLFVQSAGNNAARQLNLNQNARLAENNGYFSAVRDAELKSQVIVVGNAQFNVSQLVMNESSSYGSRVDVFAPGSYIYSTVVPGRERIENGKEVDSTAVVDSGFARMTGTSMAAPHVTGVAAMVFGVNPSFSAKQVKEIILNTATQNGVDTSSAFANTTTRLLNAEAAVLEALERSNINYRTDYGTGYVVGHVRDSETNKHIGGATIEFKNIWDGSTKTVSVNNLGLYSVELSPGLHVLQVHCDGYYDLELAIDIPEGVPAIYAEDIMLTPLSVPQTPHDDPPTTPGAGARYQVFDVAMEWHDAKEFCESIGGRLATIMSPEDQREIEEVIRKNGERIYYLIGLTDEHSHGTWTWVTGEVADYTNWMDRMPNIYPGYGTHYVALSIYDYEWLNIGNYMVSENLGFICEFDR